MKRRGNQNVLVATVGSWFLHKVLASARALQYCRAARRDERNGFPYTAAVEWHEAANLFASNSWLANRCWSEWERIMHLPRRLAQPIGTAPIETFVYENALNSKSLTQKVLYAHAA